MSFEKIEKLTIIKKLRSHKDYYEKFKNLVNYYGDILDTGALVREIGFTPHDFSHHCKDIYEILGSILPKEFYNANKEGSNLFLLLVAVLLHDYSMAQDANVATRCKHSELSMQHIKKEMFQEERSNLRDNCDRDFAGPLEDIVLAHSDIKNENGEIIRYTFKEITEKYKDRDNEVFVNQEELRVPFLAAVLRLADELDISYKRIERTGYKDKTNIAGSMSHYQICEYFGQVQLHNSSTKLVLEVFEEKFDAVSDAEKPAIASQILNRYLKIKKEFEVLYRDVLSSNRFAADGIWEIEEIQLKHEQKYWDYVKKKECLLKIQ